MSSPTVYIGVAAHKPYQMPQDNMYHAIRVGATSGDAIRGYQPDNDGDNISEKNPSYSELTAVYWMWKNLPNVQYKGLVHYRRYFTSKKSFSMFKAGRFVDVLDWQSLVNILGDFDVVVPKKRHYYVETLYSHYQHSHHIKDLEATKYIISQQYPEYLNAFDDVMGRRSAHMFNMFVMRSDLFDSYCKWLFGILNSVEQRIDISNYDQQELRVFGYISELLLDVWLEKNQLRVTEMPVMFMEKQNWFKKIGMFIYRKVRGGSRVSAHME